MSEKNIKARIQLKHDIEANWNKASTFIPMRGEVIIYDIDANYNYERLKIGDGTTSVVDLPWVNAFAADVLFDENGVIKQTSLPEGYPYASLGEVLPETNLVFEDGMAYIFDEFQLIDGSSYVVNWNGAVYNCTAQAISLEGLPCVGLGDISAMGVGESTGEPFCLLNLSKELAESLGGMYAQVNPLDGSTEAVLLISGVMVQKIDKKFLPSMGVNNIVDGSGALSIRMISSMEDSDEYTIGQGAAAFGINTKASGNYSHAEGQITSASGDASHAEGFNTEASGENSHAEGYYTNATNSYSHAEGFISTASGNASHAEGSSTEASNFQSHAEGYKTIASGISSHAEGSDTIASGSDSHAEGYNTKASGISSHAEGYYTYASSDYQHTQGRNNIVDEEGKYAHIVGNGGVSYTDVRSNAHTLDWDGNAWYAGDVYVGSTSGTNKDEGSKKLATEEYVNNAISNLDIPEGFSGSWNDLTDKPFGEAILFPHTESKSYNFSDNSGRFMADNLYFEVFDSGKIYTVIFDGVTYECQPVDLSQTAGLPFVCLGNPTIPGFPGNNTGEHFCIIVNPAYLAQSFILTTEAGTSHVVGIYESSIKTLDEEFIPNTIARKSDIPFGAGSATYIWDSEKEYETVKGNPRPTLYKISDDAISSESFIDGILSRYYSDDYQLSEVITNDSILRESEYCYSITDTIVVATADVNYMGCALTPGIWVDAWNSETKISVSTNDSLVKCLDEKYIPGTIARTKDLFSGSWNDLANKPFDGVETYKEVNWNGVATSDMFESPVEPTDVFYKVSNVIITAEELAASSYQFKRADGTTAIGHISNVVIAGNIMYDSNSVAAVVFNGPAAGLYFSKGESGYTSQLSCKVTEPTKTINERFIPSTIARAADLYASKNEFILNSSTKGSSKKFKITIDDDGILTATEITV